jgi:N-acetylglucosamine kinase
LKICADIGGSFVDVAIFGDDAAILHQRKVPTPSTDWQAFVRIFADLQAEYGDRLGDEDPISIAIAGLIDPDSGILTSANIDCIHGRPFAADLAAALGRPVIVTNDADAFVLAESALGVARGHRLVFGIILGTGVGGGLIEDGRVVTGAGGIGGEWGHGQAVPRSPVAPDATPLFLCGCGRWGCLDTVGGARGLERLHHFLHGVESNSRAVTEAWGQGDAAARATIDFYCDLTAGPLAMLLNTVPATIVPVGGGLASSTALVAELDRRVRVGLLRSTTQPILVPSVLGGNAGLLGAYLAVDRREAIAA